MKKLLPALLLPLLALTACAEVEGTSLSEAASKNSKATKDEKKAFVVDAVTKAASDNGGFRSSRGRLDLKTKDLQATYLLENPAYCYGTFKTGDREVDYITDSGLTAYTRINKGKWTEVNYNPDDEAALFCSQGRVVEKFAPELADLKLDAVKDFKIKALSDMSKSYRVELTTAEWTAKMKLSEEKEYNGRDTETYSWTMDDLTFTNGLEFSFTYSGDYRIAERFQNHERAALGLTEAPLPKDEELEEDY